MFSDLRYAFRQLLKSPGFTTGVVLTLALGIGATTSIYSVVNSALLNPVPGPDSERLMQIAQQNKETQQGDRKSTRLNSSHGYISYAVFCLKKKKKKTQSTSKNI